MRVERYSIADMILCGLSQRAIGILDDNGYIWLDQLQAATDADLLLLRNVAVKTVKEIRAAQRQVERRLQRLDRQERQTISIEGFLPIAEPRPVNAWDICRGCDLRQVCHIFTRRQIDLRKFCKRGATS